ncbi:MAG: GNAT family N-acetyltransferase [Candidatus Poseidonia sp.]|nr:GNAT family N-acetyltransferase [Poseidonia sp.]
METRSLSREDLHSMWVINEQGLPGTGQVSQEALADLLELAVLSLGTFQHGMLVGFVICLPPGTSYGSLNYAWFNNKLDAFVYVDRIAVAEEHRNQGVGRMLYEQVISSSEANGVPVAAEVNSKPPNPGSMRFHHRFGFEEIGVLHHAEKSVTMLLRKGAR